MLYRYLFFMFFYTVSALSPGAAQTSNLTATEASPAKPGPQIAPWGVDLEGMEKNVSPGENFYEFANGNWQDNAKIIPGTWSAGPHREANQRTEKLTKGLIDTILQQDWPSASDEAKFVALYHSYMPRRYVSLQRRRPIAPFLKAISRAGNHERLASQLGNYQLGAGGLFHVAVRIDPERGEDYIPSLEASALLLGKTHNYLRDERHIQALREEGAQLLETLLRRAGQRRRIKARVQAVLQLERQIAALYLSPAASRDASERNVYMSGEALAQLAPDFPWKVYFEAQGMGNPERINVRIGENLAALCQLFAQMPVRVWQDYLRLRLMSEYGAYLGDRIARPAEALEALRNGVEFVRPTVSERAARLATGLMPDVPGRAYLRRADQTHQIEAVETMAEAIRIAYRTRILAASWPANEVKQRALAKLDAVRFMIGGPPDWNDYSDYRPHERTLFANVYRAKQRREESVRSRLYRDKTAPRADIDALRSHIFFSPLRVGAYYLPRLNTVIIPANYLQAPFYDPYADMAVNFGALGTTLGHELGHAFDDQGSKYGPYGQLEIWWTPEDRAQFEALGEQLSSQFSAYQAVPGIGINAKLTLGENLSDLVGLEVAYHAYETWRVRHDQAGPGRKEGMRRFLLGYAQKRRSLRRPNVAFELALAGAHSPPVHRVNGIMRNLDFWYEAFDIGPQDRLWLPPDERVKVW